jgi:hypothetical protein
MDVAAEWEHNTLPIMDLAVQTLADDFYVPPRKFIITAYGAVALSGFLAYHLFRLLDQNVNTSSFLGSILILLLWGAIPTAAAYGAKLLASSQPYPPAQMQQIRTALQSAAAATTALLFLAAVIYVFSTGFFLGLFALLLLGLLFIAEFWLAFLLL